MNTKRLLLISALFLAAAGLAFCLVTGRQVIPTYTNAKSPRSAEPGKPGNGQNLIIISLDSVRADRMSVYGYSKRTTPNIDEFAKRGAIFTRAMAVSSWTLPTEATMLTGLYPSSHGAWSRQSRISSGTTLLSELLHDRGYRTIGMTSSSELTERFGFSRGFDVFRGNRERDQNGRKTFEALIATAQTLIRAVPPRTPYFLYLHTADTACPFNPPAEFASQFESEGAASISTETCSKIGKKVSAQEALFLSDRYDAGLKWADSRLATFFKFLEQRGDLSKTVVIVTSNHGEEFLEHHRVGNGTTLFREVLHIPLIIAAPKGVQKRFDDVVSQVDIAPTALRLLDMEVPTAMQGVPLDTVVLRGERPAKAPPFRFAELKRKNIEQVARLANDSELLVALKVKRTSLFNPLVDPQQTRNIWPGKDGGKLRSEVLEFWQSLPPPAD